jgi:ABC-type molybdate transport system substrate-binding protein
VWISELQLAVNNGDALSGSQMPDSVNRPVVYSIAFLATMDDDHRKRARDFFRFMLGDAQQIYTDGGFLPLTGTESAERYSFDKDGNFVIETFSP